MKKIIIAAVTAMVLIMPACKSTGTENPKEVLSNFLNALSKKDFTGAKKYATKDSDGMISMMEMGMQNMNNDHADKMLALIHNMEIGNPVINGDLATVSVKDKKSGESTDFSLKKESGSWKVAFDMTTLTEMANKKMKEHGMSGMGNMDSAAMGSMDSANPGLREKMEHSQKMMDSLKAMEQKKAK